MGTDDITQDEIKMYGIKFDEDPTTAADPDQIIIGDIKTGHSEAFANVTLPAPAGDKAHEASIRVKVDTGAGGNILPLRLFCQMYLDQIGPDGLPKGLTPTPTRLTAYNGTRIPQHGALDTWTRWKPHNEKPRLLRTRWYVADTQGPAILGLPSSQRLGVVTMNCAVQLKTAPSQQRTTTQELPLIQNTADLQREFPDRFQGIGRFKGKYHITLKPDARPIIHPPRKCPIAMRPHVKAELDRLEHLGAIRKVDEPTDWVSSLAYAWKPNGRVRACLDAKELNDCIKRDHHRTPTVEEITHNFAGSTVFSKVDGTASYYCVELDDESQLLTTFNSPFGRYCFRRLPPGLICSQDIFQKKIDQILEQCTGVIGIADDFCIHGKDLQEHNTRLHHFMQAAREHGLVLNIDKCSIAQRQIPFFGHVYDEHGCHPDPAKVEAVHTMSRPTSRTKLQEFLGMVTWLAPFIPNMSENTATLRELLRQDTEFTWNESYDAAFQCIKQLIAVDVTLRHYDVTRPVEIHVDASLRGLGAALVQDGKPVAFASKALTPTEQRYANIERELLAIVFGVERFHTYVYGRTFTVYTDHKPLEQIQRKTLADAPVHLQRMLLRLQGYDCTIVYRPGKEMLLADTLSRYAPLSSNEIELDVTIPTRTY